MAYVTSLHFKALLLTAYVELGPFKVIYWIKQQISERFSNFQLFSALKVMERYIFQLVTVSFI